MAKVMVDQNVIGKIDQGLLVFLGIAGDDMAKDIDFLVEKIVNLRIFSDERGKFQHSLLDIHGAALIVSQFTLYADCRRGRRPDFTAAARPEVAREMYEKFIEKMRSYGLEVATGEFGAHMQVELTNDGPVTIMLESKE